jgi:hypothetical protein
MMVAAPTRLASRRLTGSASRPFRDHRPGFAHQRHPQLGRSRQGAKSAPPDLGLHSVGGWPLGPATVRLHSSRSSTRSSWGSWSLHLGIRLLLPRRGERLAVERVRSSSRLRLILILRPKADPDRRRSRGTRTSEVGSHAQRAVAWRSGGPNVASLQNGSRGTGTVSDRSCRKHRIAFCHTPALRSLQDETKEPSWSC